MKTLNLRMPSTGFKLGELAANSFALSVNTRTAVGIAGLHAIKGIANTEGLLAEVHGFAVNGRYYTALGGR